MTPSTSTRHTTEAMPVHDHDPTDDPSAADAPAPEPARGRSPALILAITLAVVFGAAAVGLAVVAAGGSEGKDRAEGVRVAAGQFGEALVTYDFRDPDAHRDAVLALSTGSFRQEYEDAFDQGLAQIITEVEATSAGFVKDIYVSEVGEDDAQAIVVADVEHTGTGGPRTLYDVYFRLTFIEVGGEWKVDQVTDLNFDTGAAAPQDPATTSTTAAPGSPAPSLP